MNEQILEYAEQARLHAKSVFPNSIDDPTGWNYEYHKKFAELIVRECAKSIEKTIEVNCDTDDEKMGCEFAITDLLEHFGVDYNPVEE